MAEEPPGSLVHDHCSCQTDPRSQCMAGSKTNNEGIEGDAGMTRWQRGQTRGYNHVISSAIIRWDYPEMFHRWKETMRALKWMSE